MSKTQKFLLLFGLKGLIWGAYFPLWPNIILQAGYGASEIARIVAIQTAVSIILNIPTGAFADRIGHKASSMFGLLLIILGFSVPAFFGSTIIFITIAGTILAVGDSLVSGAIESWFKEIHDSDSEIELNVHKNLSVDQIQRGGMICGALVLIPLSFWLDAKFHTILIAPWVVFAVLAAIVAMVAWSIPSPAGKEKIYHPLEFKNFGKNKALNRLFIGTFFYGIAAGVFQTVLWPKLNSFIKVGLAIGLLQAGMSFTRILGISIWKKSGMIESPKVLPLSLFLSALFLFFFGFSNLFVVATILWLLLILAISVHWSALEISIINQDSKFRATNLSVAQATASLGIFSLTLWADWILKGSNNLRPVIVVGAVSLAIAGFFGRSRPPKSPA